MNPVIIILIIVVLLLLYYLYVTYIQVNTSTVNTKYDLNTSNTAIPYKNLKNGASTRYSYSLWIYVNSWSNTNTKTIISRGNDFNLTLDTTTPTLRCTIVPSAQNIQQVSQLDKTITITNSFPLQKWTYVIISVDNQIVDIYLDGKLVLSKKLNYLPNVSTNDIAIGDQNNTNDIFLTSIAYIGNPMDPQTAWNNYLNGNGMNSTYNVNMKLSVLRDNVEQGKVSLF